MKRICIVLIAVALIAAMMGCDGNGDGAPSECLEIRDWYDLDEIRNNLEGHYCLMNDLDSTTSGYAELASSAANEGSGWEPIGTDDNRFTGTLDGQGHEIEDMFVDRTDEHYVGLFGRAGGGAVIEAVGVVNATVTGYEAVGGLVGENCGTVSNCYSTGSVFGRSLSIAGLVGHNCGTVSDSYSTANVTGYVRVGGLVGGNHGGTVSDSHSTGSVSGATAVGGLVGLQNDGTVSNCYSTGSVTGSQMSGAPAGGLVGWNFDGTVTNSYSTGSVTGGSAVGGLVGANHGAVSNSFWDTETSGQFYSEGGTGKTTTEMQDIDTFSGATWDIVAVANPGIRNPSYIWNIVDTVTYPFLNWQPVS